MRLLGLGTGLGLCAAVGNTSIAQIVQGAGQPLALWDMHGSITRSTTPAALGSTPPALTLSFTGDAATRNVVWRCECTTGGESAARFRYGTVNAAGTFTPLASNQARASGVIACIGALDGFTINIPAGTYNADNVWRDVAASVADLGTSGSTQTPPSAARAPLLIMAPGNRLAVSNETGGTRMLTSSLNLPAPGTTPAWIIAVLRSTSNAGTQYLLGNGADDTAECYIAGTGTHFYNGADKLIGSTIVNSWVRVSYYMSNAAGDPQRYGTLRSTGNIGNSNPGAAFNLLGNLAGTFPGLVDVAMCGIWAALPTNLNAIDAFLLAKYPGLII